MTAGWIEIEEAAKEMHVDVNVLRRYARYRNIERIKNPINKRKLLYNEEQLLSLFAVPEPTSTEPKEPCSTH